MGFVILIVGCLLFLFVAAIIAFKNNSEIRALILKNEQLVKRIDVLSHQLSSLQKRFEETQEIKDLLDISESPPVTSKAEKPEEQTATTLEEKPAIPEPEKTEDKSASEPQAPVVSHTVTPPVPELVTNVPKPAQEAPPSPKEAKKAKSKSNVFDLENLIKGNGLLWLGGIVLALGGIFLAKYSIEANLISPEVRVLLGGAFGLALLVAAEFLNRNKERFNINSPYITAAIASGGIITCFAMTQVAFDYYHFISAQTAFALMAFISLLCISLALRYGPLLAGIGIIGAYAVPALVSTGSNNIFALLIYVSFVSGSAIWVANRVQQSWLWWQSFVGHFIWLAAAISLGDKQDFGIVLFTCLLSVYYYVALDILGWKLQGHHTTPMPIKTLLMPRKEQVAVLLPVILLAIFLTMHPSDLSLVLANLLLTGFLCFLAWRHGAFDTWPFICLGFALYSFTLFSSPESYEDNLFPFTGAWLFVQVSILIGLLFSFITIKQYPERHSYLLLLVLTPLSLFGLSYALSPVEAEAILYPLWATELLVCAALSTWMATRQQPVLHKVTWLILSNGCLSLCLTMLLEASTLTLALVIQVASMSYLTQKYLVALPDWLYKVVLALVTLRLTAAPWSASYAGETIFSVHWTLIIYPLVIGLLWVSRHYNTSESLKPWFTGIMVHVLALFVTTETSWFLSEQYPNLRNLGFEEATILSLNWMILGIVYLFRQRFSDSLKTLYQIAGYILVTLALLTHLNISFANTPYFTDLSVGTGVFNWLLPLWALPAALLLIMRYQNLLQPALHKVVTILAGVFIFFYVNAMIRTSFQEGQINLAYLTPQSELYTYSIVWLVLSTVCIFVAQHFQKTSLRNIGFSLLAMVILKAFLVDMAHLDGLYRALSFIGLGICLVGIGWLFQKMQKQPTPDLSERVLEK